MTWRIIGVVAFLAAFTLCVPRASGDGASVTHEIVSEHTGRKQTIEVSLPRSYADHPQFQYPLLVLLDGESNLEHATAVVRFLAENGTIPEMIVAGVHAGPTRAQDYTSTPLREGMPAHGDRFLEFIRLELLPFLDQEFRAAPLRLISGHSLGGAFVTSTLIEHPDLFNGYIVQSPYLPDDFGDAILTKLASTIDRGVGPQTYYYANLGDEPDLRAAFIRLRTILTDASTIRVTTEIHLRETHMSTRLIGLYDGLERFFEPRWPFEGDVAALPAHVASLAASYGFDVLYAESTFQTLIQQALASGRGEAAINSAKLYAKQHSYSPVPHFLLAAVLATSGDVNAARAAIRVSAERYNADPRKQWASIDASIRSLSQQLGVDQSHGN